MQHKWQLFDCEIKYIILLLLTYIHYNGVNSVPKTPLVFPSQNQWLSLVYVNSFYSFP
jgi:hypothetical protein